jgi:hypothetical protein
LTDGGPDERADLEPRGEEPSRAPGQGTRLAMITAVLGFVTALLTVIGALLPLLLHLIH